MTVAYNILYNFPPTQGGFVLVGRLKLEEKAVEADLR